MTHTMTYAFEPPVKRTPERYTPQGRIPRISRLMALAITFDRMIHAGDVRDRAHLAAIGHVTRARMTQIMNLLNLAPDIQEELLLLPETVKGRDPIHERILRPISREMDWKTQRRMWRRLKERL